MLRRRKYSGIVYDPAAVAYFTAAGITSPTEKAAVNTLILGLRVAGLYTKFDRLWLRSPTSQAASLIDFITLASSTAINAPTWSKNGFVYNGTSQYIKTNYSTTGSTRLSANDQSMGVYVRTGVGGTNKYLMGSNGAAGVTPIQLYCASTPANFVYVDGAATKTAAGSGTAFNGLLMGTSQSATDLRLLKNGVEIANTVTNETGALSTINLSIGANNSNGLAANFANFEECFAFVSSGLTTPQCLTLYNLIQTYQTNVV